MATQQLWRASPTGGIVHPFPVHPWGFWSRQLLAGLTILVVAAVLSLVLFPAGHGLLVSTHGPVTAVRSRRLFLIIRPNLAAVIVAMCGILSAFRQHLIRSGDVWPRLLCHTPSAACSLAAVLLC